MGKPRQKLRKSLRERFEEKVFPDPISGCWIWGGAVKELGYGVIGLGRRSDGTAKAHRVSYEIHKGAIPEGGCVLHRCDVPSCVNPDHLFVGSLSDNMSDCVAKKRNFIPDNNGEKATWAKLTAEDAKIILGEKNKYRGIGTELARRFGVSKSAIYQIWGRTNWKTLDA